MRLVQFGISPLSLNSVRRSTLDGLGREVPLLAINPYQPHEGRPIIRQRILWALDSH
jgi:hypothetical protein